MSRKLLFEIFIGVLAIVSIVLVAVETAVPVSQSTLTGIYITDLVICAVFAADFIRRLIQSDNRSRFWLTNGYEILAMIPAVSLYALGTIPAISTAFRALRLVRVVLLLARMRRAMAASGGFLQRSHLLALAGITVSVILTGAFAAYVLESGTENAQITTFSDAVWWSLSTVTTVGYGDIVPHSLGGRVMGMGLMVVGIGVMTAFISQVSAALVESRLKRTAVKNDVKSAVIAEIKNKLDNLSSLSENDINTLIKLIQALK